ncbi:cytochrome b/b6 domain-containing protein [Vibrio ulleungensis]|uniref:Cytochrome b/b6 domain-containing protein n=1 Tax=Vibrio ulleungensis TaxID=2807619 RepID=A0ABS2HEN6_9VIBR|nr:cytochrome b/b6 domain-containing protein [Vibrio ulleungensis]MBM7036045.1 cytochrome b/b6 domain-containing protein [Vibrio ulleungensis]
MKIWDLPTRLYHWGQAVLVVAMIITGNLGEGPHFELGLLLITLILWRIVWGILGSETSRFSQFLAGPKRVFNYLSGREDDSVGHNPAGGWMVLAMILLLFIQCITGMVVGGLFDEVSITAPLITDEVYDLAVATHEWGSTILPYVIGVHLAAIAMYKVKGKPLVKAMVTGHSDLKTSRQVKLESTKKALIVLLFVVPFSAYFFYIL